MSEFDKKLLVQEKMVENIEYWDITNEGSSVTLPSIESFGINRVLIIVTRRPGSVILNSASPNESIFSPFAVPAGSVSAQLSDSSKGRVIRLTSIYDQIYKRTAWILKESLQTITPSGEYIRTYGFGMDSILTTTGTDHAHSVNISTVRNEIVATFGGTPYGTTNSYKGKVCITSAAIGDLSPIETTHRRRIKFRFRASHPMIDDGAEHVIESAEGGCYFYNETGADTARAEGVLFDGTPITYYKPTNFGAISYAWDTGLLVGPIVPNNQRVYGKRVAMGSKAWGTQGHVGLYFNVNPFGANLANANVGYLHDGYKFFEHSSANNVTSVLRTFGICFVERMSADMLDQGIFLSRSMSIDLETLSIFDEPL
jgi:hypothetical protein